MIIFGSIAVALPIAAIVYLVFALMKPERF